MATKKLKSRLPIMLTMAAIHFRKEQDARDHVLSKARAYAHLFLAAGHIADRNEQFVPIMPEIEEKRLEELIEAVEYYDEVVTPSL